MPQDAAQAVMNIARKPYDAVQRGLSYIPDNLPGMRRVDTSGHDEMVRQAQRTFQQRADADRAAAAAQAAAPAVATAKRTPKRTPARPVAKRR